jgi:hypothetical protein
MPRFRSCFIACCVLTTSTLFAYPDGSGSVSDPYLIDGPGDWQTLMNSASDWSSNFRLTSNISLTGLTITPIGSSSNQFTGCIDGDGHVIQDVYIYRTTTDYQGLFGYIGAAGQVKNLNLSNVTITGRYYLGALAASNAGQITNCSAAATVKGSCVGGLVGLNSGTITNCHANCTVSNSTLVSNHIAGFVYSNSGSVTGCASEAQASGGINIAAFVVSNGGTISNCYATGAVSGSNYLGGLASSNTGTISQCHTDITITGGGYCGGLVSQNTGIIERSFAGGTITGTTILGGLAAVNGSNGISDCFSTARVAGGSVAGGLVGQNYSTGYITNCYSVGLVSGTGSLGGLCAWEDNSMGSHIYYSCWDKQTSNQSTSAGGLGFTTEVMKSLMPYTPPYGNWNFSSIWALCENTNYPRLRWSIPTGDIACPDGVGCEDLNVLATGWLVDNCAANSNCDGADLDNSDSVDFVDLAILAQSWLSF